MRVKARIFSGVVCEQYVFTVSDRTKNVKTAEPRPRFKTNVEREEYNYKKAARHFARIVNQNFTPASYYCTLTLDAEHEIHDFPTAFQEFENYTRRLKRKYPDARFVWVMGRGKATHRIHFHMIIDGVPESDISAKWGMGDVKRIEHLRERNRNPEGVNVGQDYSALACYLFAHWTKEQGGHYWHGTTRNLRQPDREATKPVKRNYSLTNPPRCPKGYTLTETSSSPYGYLYYKYVKLPAPKKRGRRSKADTD